MGHTLHFGILVPYYHLVQSLNLTPFTTKRDTQVIAPEKSLIAVLPKHSKPLKYNIHKSTITLCNNVTIKHLITHVKDFTFTQ